MLEPMIEFLESYDRLQDTTFRDYAREINGLVGPASVEMLAECVKHIDEDKCYLEVGTFQGMSLLGTAMRNPDVSCYGVENFAEEFKDNWDKFDPNKRSNQHILHHNLEKFGKGNASVFEQDYRTFFQNRKDVNGKKAEVYLYDGPHSYEHQVFGLILAQPLLADHAIVFIDDYKCPNVPKSIDRVLAMNNGYKRQIKSWVNPYEDFREGFVALEFKNES